MKEKEFTEYLLKYLEKNGLTRFSEFNNWINTVSTEPPSKGSVSGWLDNLNEKNIICSWNEKGARYISMPFNNGEIQKSVTKRIDKILVSKEKVSLDELMQEFKCPQKLVQEALTRLVSKGKLINSLEEETVYYSLPPLHLSVKIGTLTGILFAVLYAVGRNQIDKQMLFTISIGLIAFITLLWYKYR